VNNVSDESSDQTTEAASVHERLGDLCINFHQLQDDLLKQAGPEQGERMRHLAAILIELTQQHLDQVLGELFLAEHANYNFSKPLYVGASLVELIRRYNQHSKDSTIDDDKRDQLVLAAMGYNLGLLADERRVYETQQELSPEEKRELREHYPQQSAKILESAGLDQAVIQDVVQNHNLVSDNPSKDALLMRTPFIYAGIAIPQNLDSV